jgi:hypothetical protein
MWKGLSLWVRVEAAAGMASAPSPGASIRAGQRRARGWSKEAFESGPNKSDEKAQQSYLRLLFFIVLEPNSEHAVDRRTPSRSPLDHKHRPSSKNYSDMLLNKSEYPSHW